MAASIIGLGTALPHSLIPTDLFIEHAQRFCCRSPKQERVLAELYRRTEIDTRCSVLSSYSYGDRAKNVFAPPVDPQDQGPGTAERMELYRKEAAPLAVSACRQAIAVAQIDPATITHLVSVSCTGFYAPGFDIELVQQLPLSPHTQRTHVGFMGCHGAMNGLRAAAAYANADPKATILLCTSELCSLHFQYGWGSDKLVANSLFSDGAAAMVIRNAATAGPAAAQPAFQHIDSASFIVPDTTDLMMWRIGDNGFNMKLSSRIPEVVSQTLPPWLDAFLGKNGLSRADINGWAVHPGGPRILDAIEQCLALTPEALSHSRAILAECGNMSSPTVLFILQRMQSLNIGGPIVVLGFGPGLTIEAALLRGAVPDR